MATTEEIKQLVITYWPEYVEVAGAQYTDRIIEAVAQGRDPNELFHATRGGDKFDLFLALTALAAVVSLVKNGLDLYDRTSKEFGKKLSKEELAQEITGNISETDKLPPDVIEGIPQVAQSIIKMKSEQDNSSA